MLGLRSCWEDALLAIFDEGRLTDGRGKTYDFTNTIIIATSNLGAQAIRQATERINRSDEKARVAERVFKEVLRGTFSPEFINRFNGIFFFSPLTREEQEQVLDLKLAAVRRKWQGMKMDLTVTKEVREAVLQEGVSEEYGARPLENALERLRKGIRGLLGK